MPVSRYGSLAAVLSRWWASAGTKFPAWNAILKNMDSRDLMSTVAVMDDQPAHGVRVHVSDASPRGFWGHVTAVHRDAVTVTRDSGACELVILSRRRVTVVNWWPWPRTRWQPDREKRWTTCRSTPTPTAEDVPGCPAPTATGAATAHDAETTIAKPIGNTSSRMQAPAFHCNAQYAPTCGRLMPSPTRSMATGDKRPGRRRDDFAWGPGGRSRGKPRLRLRHGGWFGQGHQPFAPHRRDLSRRSPPEEHCRERRRDARLCHGLRRFHVDHQHCRQHGENLCPGLEYRWSRHPDGNYI